MSDPQDPQLAKDDLVPASKQELAMKKVILFGIALGVALICTAFLQLGRGI